VAARVVSVCFEGVEARRVDVEVQAVGGYPAFVVVGLADKAVGEARERVRAAFAGLGLALPPRRLVANLAPADLPKEGRGHRSESCRVRQYFQMVTYLWLGWPLP